MRLPSPTSRRDGMTLLEVLLALAIFLFSLVAISQLFNTATDQASEIQWRSRAARLAQSKLNEYVSGVRSLSATGSGTFDPEEPDWNWTATSLADDSTNGLYKVTITVSRDLKGKHIETSLSQYILDPKVKGGFSPPASSGSSTTSSSTAASTTPTPAAAPAPASTVIGASGAGGGAAKGGQ